MVSTRLPHDVPAVGVATPTAGRPPPSGGWSPYGTATQRFRSHSPYGAAHHGFGGLLDHLRAAVSRHDLGDEAVYVAWEMTQWQADLEAEDQAALLLLVVVSLITMRQGSTRFPVAGDEGRAYLQGLLEPIIGCDGPLPLTNMASTLTHMQTLLTADRAPLLVGGPDDYKPFLWVPPYLYTQKLWQQEAQLLQRLTQLIQRPLFPVPEPRLVEVMETLRRYPPRIEGTALHLSAEQEYAVLTAVHNPVTVICGGPGTGKTSIVVFILRLLAHLGVPPQTMALAAPTGKAAQRLGASIQQTLRRIDQPHFDDAPLLRACPEPSTLHRLLGYAPGRDRFFHHEHNRLAQQVVIVDEASMIDLFLMERLVRAVRDDVRLILLGDADQLPSVDTGTVLRDVMPPALDTQTPWRALVRGRLPAAAADIPEHPLARSAVRLQRSYRMRADDPGGRAILTLAAQINAGQVSAAFSSRKRRVTSLTPRPAVSDLCFDRVEHLDCPDPAALLEPFLDRWDRECLRGEAEIDALMNRVYPYGPEGFSPDDTDALHQLFQHLDRCRILCLTRVYATGSEAVNTRLHARRAKALGLVASHASLLADDLLPGEPVLMLRNDYDKRLYNGDQGLVLTIALQGGESRASQTPQAPQAMVVFPVTGRFAVFHFAALRGQMTLAYALTVHKSQGSEFDRVALVLPDSDIPLLTREMLYTAVTRSKHSVTIIGSAEVFKCGMTRTIQRFSGMAEKLRHVYPSFPDNTIRPSAPHAQNI